MATFHGAFRMSQQTNMSVMRRWDDAYLSQGTGNGVTAGVANGSMLGSGESGDKRDNGNLGKHVVECVWYYGINA
jgi:choline dehydrogenase-like flavoprotein